MSTPSPKTKGAGFAFGTEWSSLHDKLGFVPSFEGLRGLAILMVLCHHTGPFTPFMCSMGRGGVAIFFTLSGFLITGVLKVLYSDSPTLGFALRRFYLDRCMRLSPPIALACLYGFYMSYRQGEEPTRLAVWAIRIFTYTSNLEYEFLQHLLPFEPRTTAIWFDHLWSLCVEEQFYIFWSLALAVYLKFKLRIWVLWAAFVYFQYAAWRIAYYPSPFYNWHSKQSLGSALSKMLLGCLLRLSPLPKPIFTWYIGAPLAYFAFGLAYVLALRRTTYDSEHIVTAVCAYATALWLPSLVTSGNWLLETRILRFVGRVSYSLYVYHFIQQTFDNTRFAHLRAWETVSLAFIAASVSTIFVEEPLCRVYRKWSRRADQPRQPAEVAMRSNDNYVTICLDKFEDVGHSTVPLSPSAGSVLTYDSENDEKKD